ncbi:MAG: hypothetical protein PUG22_02385 [Peptoniphilaceae bacterium]|nr:hypothetical protein [Peptoniphilaceae bacterium]
MSTKNFNYINYIDYFMIVVWILMYFLEIFVDISNIEIIKFAFLILNTCYIAVFLSNKTIKKSILFFLPSIFFTLIYIILIKKVEFSFDYAMLVNFINYFRSIYGFFAMIFIIMIFEKIVRFTFGNYFSIAISILFFIIYYLIVMFEFFPEIYAYRRIFIVLFYFFLFSEIKIEKNPKYKFGIGLLLSIFALFLEIYSAKKMLFRKNNSPISFVIFFYFLFKFFASKIDNFDFNKYFLFSIFFILPIIEISVNMYTDFNIIKIRLIAIFITFAISFIIKKFNFLFTNYFSIKKTI